MMKRMTIICFVLFAIAEAHAYDNKLMHQLINTESALLSQNFLTTMKTLGFAGNLSKEIIELNYVNNRRIKDWISEGGKSEDEPLSRTFNHFHDPTKTWDDAGLKGSWIGCSSILWAQNKCNNANDKWSWLKARGYYYEALTSTDAASREQNFADKFRALGQQMHLLSDAAVPEHTRNDMHIFPLFDETDHQIGKWTYETWCKHNSNNLNTTTTAIDLCHYKQFSGFRTGSDIQLLGHNPIGRYQFKSDRAGRIYELQLRKQ